jgi:hypothetical protein
MGLFSKRPAPFERDRHLTDDNPSPRTFNNTDIDDSNDNLAKKLFSDIRENIEAANALLPLIEEKCRATHIPVDESLQEVRSAVIRKDTTEPNGERISHSLFLTAIKKYEEVQLQYTLSITENVTGSPDFDSVAVRDMKTRIIAGVSSEDLLLFNSIWLLNYAISKYQDIFNIPTTMKIAPENPAGLAVGAMQLVISAAFAAAIEVLFDSLGDEEVTSASTFGEDVTYSRIDRLALAKISENDYKIILNYAIKYIYTSTDPKYDPWVNYLILRRTRNQSIDTYKYYPVYSNSEFIRVNSSLDEDESNSGDYVDDYRRNQFLSKFKEHLGLHSASSMERYLSTTTARNRVVLNNVAQVSAYRTTKAQVCCLLRILTISRAFDKKTFILLKCLNKAAGMTMTVNFAKTFAGRVISRITSPNFEGMQTNYIQGVVSRMIRQVYNRLIVNANDAMTEDLYVKCRMFLVMLESALSNAEDFLKELGVNISSAEKELETEMQEHENTLQSKWQVRLLNDIDLMLSAIIEQSLDECYHVSDDVVEEMLDNTVSGLDIPSNQYTINIPDDIRERYFSDSKPIRIKKRSSFFDLDSTLELPAIDKINQPETSEEVVRNILKTCKIEISDNQIRNMLKETDGSSE